MDQRVGGSEAFPGRFSHRRSLDDPGIALQDLGVGFEILVVRYRVSALPELDPLSCGVAYLP
jgi:hypothetical protein